MKDEQADPMMQIPNVWRPNGQLVSRKMLQEGKERSFTDFMLEKRGAQAFEIKTPKIHRQTPDQLKERVH
jgi:hypothetical protein